MFADGNVRKQRWCQGGLHTTTDVLGGCSKRDGISVSVKSHPQGPVPEFQLLPWEFSLEMTEEERKKKKIQ